MLWELTAVEQRTVRLYMEALDAARADADAYVTSLLAARGLDGERAILNLASMTIEPRGEHGEPGEY